MHVALNNPGSVLLLPSKGWIVRANGHNQTGCPARNGNEYSCALPIFDTPLGLRLYADLSCVGHSYGRANEPPSPGSRDGGDEAIRQDDRMEGMELCGHPSRRIRFGISCVGWSR